MREMFAIFARASLTQIRKKMLTTMVSVTCVQVLLEEHVITVLINQIPLKLTRMKTELVMCAIIAPTTVILINWTLIAMDLVNACDNCL